MRLLVFATLALLASPARAEDREPVHLRVGTQAVEGSRYMKDMAALGADVERRTKGAIVIDFVWGGQLGEEAAMAELVATGKLDGGAFSATGLEALVPEMAAFASPGLFANPAQTDRATTALDGPVRERFAARGLVFAMWADLGFAHVFSATPMGSIGAALAAAAPVIEHPLDGALVEAIARGRVRAWAVPPLYMLAMPAGKPRRMWNLRHHYVIGGLVISDRAWSRIPAGEQTKLREAFATWAPRLRASWRKESERGLLALQKAGVELQAASLDEARAFVAEARERRAPTDLAKAIAAAIDP